MFKIYYLVSVIWITGLSAKAQNDTMLIKETVNSLFKGMLEFDSARVRSCFLPNAELKSIGWDVKKNSTRIDETPMSKFYEVIGTVAPNTRYIEKIHSMAISIDRNMAVVWAPYTFYINEKMSHCGVNSITLARVSEGWRILQIIDTRSKENCKP
jgi:hypothetical protein